MSAIENAPAKFEACCERQVWAEIDGADQPLAPNSLRRGKAALSPTETVIVQELFASAAIAAGP